MKKLDKKALESLKYGERVVRFFAGKVRQLRFVGKMPSCQRYLIFSDGEYLTHLYINPKDGSFSGDWYSGNYNPEFIGRLIIEDLQSQIESAKRIYLEDESEKLEKDLESEDNDIKSWSLFYKVKRAKRLETFEREYLDQLQKLVDVEIRKNGSYTFNFNDCTYDFFPKKNALLCRKDNTWSYSGITWICENILNNNKK